MGTQHEMQFWRVFLHQINNYFAFAQCWWWCIETNFLLVTLIASSSHWTNDILTPLASASRGWWMMMHSEKSLCNFPHTSSSSVSDTQFTKYAHVEASKRTLHCMAFHKALGSKQQCSGTRVTLTHCFNFTAFEITFQSSNVPKLQFIHFFIRSIRYDTQIIRVRPYFQLNCCENVTRAHTGVWKQIWSVVDGGLEVFGVWGPFYERKHPGWGKPNDHWLCLDHSHICHVFILCLYWCGW